MRTGGAGAIGHQDVHSLVPDAPVNASIRPHPQAMHIVSGIGNMVSESMGNALPLLRDAIAIGIRQLPHIRGNGAVNRSFMRHHPGGDAGDLRAEIRGENGGGIRPAIPILIRKLKDGFGRHGEVHPIHRTVLVGIRQTTCGAAQFPRSEHFVEEGAFLPDVFQSHIARHPTRPLPDIQIAHFPPGCQGDVDPALVIHGTGHRVRHGNLAGPTLRLQRRPLGDGIAGQGERQQNRQGGKTGHGGTDHNEVKGLQLQEMARYRMARPASGNQAVLTRPATAAWIS